MYDVPIARTGLYALPSRLQTTFCYPFYSSLVTVFQRHPSFSTALTTINMASFEKDSFIKLLQMQVRFSSHAELCLSSKFAVYAIDVRGHRRYDKDMTIFP